MTSRKSITHTALSRGCERIKVCSNTSSAIFDLISVLYCLRCPTIYFSLSCSSRYSYSSLSCYPIYWNHYTEVLPVSKICFS